MKTVDLARAGLMIAVVFVITRLFVLPIPQTKGFFNLGEAGIYAAAMLFGPLVAALAGGIGSALADLSLGFTQFAPFTLVIKGAEGWLVGALLRRAHAVPAQVGAMLAGGAVMVLGYFLTQAVALGLGVPAALTEVPYNLVQVAVGVIAGLGAATGLRRAVPSMNR